MIQNRRELQTIARDWMKKASNNLKKEVSDFIEKNDTDAEEIAYALDIPYDDIEAILDGDASEISLETFAKLLIGTNNVIKVMPLSEAKKEGLIDNDKRYPRAKDSERANTRQRRSECERTASSQPNRLPNGRFAPRTQRDEPIRQERQGEMRRVRLDQVDFDEQPMEILKDMIRQNHWDSEIDVDDASREDLIDLLNEKVHGSANESSNTRQATNSTRRENRCDETQKLAKMLADEIERNPHLSDLVKKYLG